MARARSIRGRRLLFVLLVVFCAAVIPAIFVPTLMCRQADPTLDDLGVVPPFHLVDAQGQAFTESALRDHPTIVDFIFTRCDSICPVVSGTMERAQERMGDSRGLPVKFLSITVDPAFDTPAVLAAYAKQFHANPDRWKFVTGVPADVLTLVGTTFMNSTRVEGTSPAGIPSISHTAYYVLVDGNLHIRGVYDSGDPNRLEELLHHARFLARTTKPSYKFGN